METIISNFLSNSRQCVNIRIINQQEKPLTKNSSPTIFKIDNEL